MTDPKDSEWTEGESTLPKGSEGFSRVAGRYTPDMTQGEKGYLDLTSPTYDEKIVEIELDNREGLPALWAKIPLRQIIHWKAACKLELKGMKHSRGSVFPYVFGAFEIPLDLRRKKVMKQEMVNMLQFIVDESLSPGSRGDRTLILDGFSTRLEKGNK